jgi:nucleoside-diphosphate-sugar epimerase
MRFHIGDADQSLPAIIFIPRPVTSPRRFCAGRAPLSRSQNGRRCRGRGLGHRHSSARVPLRHDLADAGLHLLQHYSGDSHINIGAGYDITIAAFAEQVKRCVEFEGRIVYDRSRPDGTPRKLLDSSRIQAVGWKAATSLEEGLRLYYDWFLSNQGKLRETVIEPAISD